MSARPAARPRCEVTVLVEAPAWLAALPAVEATVERAATAALAACPARVPARAELAVALADDAAVRRLNLSYRGKDAPTNVLSFPAAPARGRGPVLLGDVVVAYETTAAEAAADGKTLTGHLTHLVVHGVLHLLGYDHETDPQAAEMEGLERIVLAELGISDPYAARDAD